MRPPSRLSLPALHLAAALTLTGCAFQQTNQTATPGTALSGTVHGGQQVVTGSTIQLYAAGTTGYASAATPLLTTTVTTDANGNFLITGDYTCPTPTTQVYLTATGGNPGLTPAVNNTALALMVALGNCGSLTSTERVVINEVTTVAAVWSLQQFMSSYANIGSSVTNAVGLANAFTNATSIVGMACGCATPSSTDSTPTRIMPQYAVNTLANALAACVNSNGSTSSGTPCANLFAAATSSTSTPADTVAAAFNIAQNPAANVSTIFSIAAANAPFQPTLPAAPNDWTLAASFLFSYYGNPQGAALDQNGVFTMSFADVGSGGFYSFGFNANIAQGYNYALGSIAFDGSGNLWDIAIYSNKYQSVNFNPTSGAVVKNFAVSNGQLAFDSLGNQWIAAYNQLLAYNSAGSQLASNTDALTTPAADISGNIWGTIGNSLVKETLSGSAINHTLYTSGLVTSPMGIAIDHAGSIWVLNQNSTLSKFTSAGVPITSTTAFSGGGLSNSGTSYHFGTAIALDGSGNLWAPSYACGCISEFSPSGTALSPATGFGTAVAANHTATQNTFPMTNPEAALVDQSGNVWTIAIPAFYSYEYITEFLGLATPTTMPLALAAATNTIATRP